MEYLEKLRSEIDDIDRELIKLFEKRIDIVLKIGDYKKNKNMEIFQEDREKQVLKNALSNLENTEYSEEIVRMLSCIMDISKDIQKEKI
ncbi:chorismate mutase [Asaccharospora irregularis]|uniref:Monofunctional chorismate mutase n=1 Tax=Asaccharospora irregularis DSM 2635 TaxID=1121321 RepID=A0A1M5T1Q4_9FIRM|nr:chorismate mutase [Asaccharospora irregularis]SHH44602.1 monofunctional chorismate mutase [Asaccharospora irregularis DSM 2635]